MNPVNGPVLVILLLVIVVLLLAVGAQRRVIIRTRNTLRHSQSRCRVLRAKRCTCDEPHTCLSSGQFRPFATPPAVREWTEAAARERHPVGKGRGLRVVAGGGE